MVYLFSVLLFFSDQVWSANGSACSIVRSPIAKVATKNLCEEVKQSAHCQQMYDKIKKDGGDVASKELKCSNNPQSHSVDVRGMVFSCLVGGVFEATFGALGRGLGESIAESNINDGERRRRLNVCDNDLKYKQRIYSTYNHLMPKVLQVAVPSDHSLNATSCETLESRLKRSARAKQQAASLKYTYATFNNPTKIDQPGREYLAWRDRQDALKNPVRSVSESEQSILDLAYEKLGEFGVRLECYNSEAAAALACELLFYIASGYGAARALTVKAISGMGAGKKAFINRAPAELTEEEIRKIPDLPEDNFLGRRDRHIENWLKRQGVEHEFQSAGIITSEQKYRYWTQQTKNKRVTIRRSDNPESPRGRIQADNLDGDGLSGFDYTFQDAARTHVKVEEAWTVEPYRGTGLNNFLNRAFINVQTQVKTVSASLADMNKKALTSALASGKTLKEAALETPLVKSWAHEGFQLKSVTPSYDPVADMTSYSIELVRP